MRMRKYDMMMLVRHAKHGNGQARYGRCQRRTVVLWVGMACPMSYRTRSELARAHMQPLLTYVYACRKYDMIGMPGKAKHGDGQVCDGRYQRHPVVMWVAMACPTSSLTRSELARVHM